MKGSWDDRYAPEEYIYGVHPNDWFRQVVDNLPPGRMLVPGAGEGRDAVYAATRGWEVTAFDQSSRGREKALRLAALHGACLDYRLADAKHFDPAPLSFDLVALIYVHLPLSWRHAFHRRIREALSPGGFLLLEAFTPDQIPNDSGGPKDPDLLYTPEQLRQEFAGLEIIENRKTTIVLEEGLYHSGPAEVVRFLGTKNTNT
jgi:SAM-dependent methyltransferase